MNVREELLNLKDEKFKKFNASLIPNVDKEKVIGVKNPYLREMAKRLVSTGKADGFLDDLPHNLHEENVLHFFVIELIKDYDECVRRTDEFLPYVDNWAVCDYATPKVFKKTHDRLIVDIKRWLNSDRLYTNRFAMRMLMSEFLDKEFDVKYLEWVGNVETNEYYLQMMQGWYFATALAKQYEATLEYLKAGNLSETVLKMTVKKANESFRVSPEHKIEVKKLLK